MAFLIWYVLPFVFVILFGPKVISAYSNRRYYKTWYPTPIIRKDIIHAFFYAVIPCINLIAALFIFFVYLVDIGELLDTTDKFEQPLFKDKHARNKKH